MFSPQQAGGFSLNVVGAKVWERLESSRTGMTLSQLVAELAPQFAVSVDQLKADMKEYVRELEAKGLIMTNGSSSFVSSTGRGML
ncbi:MAG: PqqD family protein [Acidobacteria bacterium]|nr:PqqD family protein [Acidobacteriota bacterium]